jgi:hypothetical protein
LHVMACLRHPSEPISATPESYDRFILTVYGTDQPWHNLSHGIVSCIAWHQHNRPIREGKWWRFHDGA